MNKDFPRIMTLLRKERGLSQKQAAADLDVTQALLSHYENGKRECGLDFLVRAADYYKVSVDYLLGRSPMSSGASISEQELPESTDAEKYEGTLRTVGILPEEAADELHRDTILTAYQGEERGAFQSRVLLHIACGLPLLQNGPQRRESERRACVQRTRGEGRRAYQRGARHRGYPRENSGNLRRLRGR